MKKVISALIFLLIVNYSNAQLGFLMRAGVQNTDIKVTKTRADQDIYNNKSGWYAGAQAAYLTKEKIVITAGAGISVNKYEQIVYSVADALPTNNYTLVFLELPVSIGYHFTITKMINLQLSGGGYFYVGLSGENKQNMISLYPGYSETNSVNKIRFGNEENYGDVFRKVNTGLQTSVSIGFNNKIYVEGSYKLGTKNILTKGVDDYEDQKIRVFSIGLKYNLLNHIKEKRNPEASYKKAF